MSRADWQDGATRDGPHAVAVAVLVADDQSWFRGIMRDVVAAAPNFRLVGEVGSGEAAVEAVGRLAPGLVIIDKRMPGMGGIEACRVITQRHPDVFVLVCSVEDPDPRLIEGCGASAFIRKQELSPRLLAELWRQHASGSTFGSGGGPPHRG